MGAKNPVVKQGAIIHHLKMVIAFCRKPLAGSLMIFAIGEKKIRMLISENTDTDYCFTVQVGNKSLINRHKFEEFLNQTTSLLKRKIRDFITLKW